MNRRQFMQGLAALVGGAAIVPALPIEAVGAQPLVDLPVRPSVLVEPPDHWQNTFLTIDGVEYPLKSATLSAEQHTQPSFYGTWVDSDPTHRIVTIDATVYWSPQIDTLMSHAVVDRTRTYDVEIGFRHEQITYVLPMVLRECSIDNFIGGKFTNLCLVGDNRDMVQV